VSMVQRAHGGHKSNTGTEIRPVGKRLPQQHNGFTYDHSQQVWKRLISLIPVRKRNFNTFAHFLKEK
jgi:hypothetical protein